VPIQVRTTGEERKAMMQQMAQAAMMAQQQQGALPAPAGEAMA